MRPLLRRAALDQVAFVRRDDFLRFIAHHPDAYLGIVRQLNASYGGACDQLRNVGFQRPVHQRICRLLLHWAAESKGIRTENELWRTYWRFSRNDRPDLLPIEISPPDRTQGGNFDDLQSFRP
jgi:hypothetical protein